MLNSRDIEQIFSTFSKSIEIPKTELEYKNYFTLLVAIVLSAQTTDIAVNKATESLFVDYDDPDKMLSLGEEGLKAYIKTIGLYNSKAKNVIALSRILVDIYDSKVPRDFEQLIALPGVGRKTANVFLNCAYGEARIAVDTHVFRVSHRLGLAETNTPNAVEQELLQVIPDKWHYYAHHWLILHGRYVCKARKPECEKCLVQQYCEYYKEMKI